MFPNEIARGIPRLITTGCRGRSGFIWITLVNMDNMYRQYGFWIVWKVLSTWHWKYGWYIYIYLNM